MILQIFREDRNGDIQCLRPWKSVNTRSDQGKCHAFTSQLLRLLQAVLVACPKVLQFPVISSGPGRSYRMNDVSCMKCESRCGCSLTYIQSSDPGSLRKEQFGSRCLVDRPVRTIRIGRFRVRRIHYRICFHFGYVISDDPKCHTVTSKICPNIFCPSTQVMHLTGLRSVLLSPADHSFLSTTSVAEP